MRLRTTTTNTRTIRLGWTWFSFLIHSVMRTTNAVASSVVSLTVDNLPEMTDQKAVFIKFFAPWCGHCKQLAPDWERLADDWKDSSTGLIAQVDCTDPAAESLCDEYGVDGYPTLIYGDAYSPELYEGDRDYESLAAFAQEHLTTIPCSLRNLAACPPDIQTVIQQLRDTSRQDLLIMEQAIDAELDQAEDAYETAMEQLNDQYTQLVDNYNAQLKHIRDEKHYKWLQMVLAESDPPLEDLMMDMDDDDLDEDDDDDDDTNPSTDEL